LVCRYNFLNQQCLPEPPAVALGSTPVSWGGGPAVSAIGLSSAHCSEAPLACYSGTSSACRSGAPLACCYGTSSARHSGAPLACCSGTPFACCLGTPIACCWGTPSVPFDCSSIHVLRGGAFVLGGGATGTSSTSNHSDIAVLHVRVVWSPPSEMPPGLRGAAPAIFLFFRAGSSAAALFPRFFSDTGDGLSDKMLMVSSSGYVSGRASTVYGQLPLGMPEKYTALSYEWIFA